MKTHLSDVGFLKSHVWPLDFVFLRHLPDDNVADVDVGQLLQPAVVHVLAERRVATAHNERLVGWRDVLVDDMTQFWVFPVPEQKKKRLHVVMTQ